MKLNKFKFKIDIFTRPVIYSILSFLIVFGLKINLLYAQTPNMVTINQTVVTPNAGNTDFQRITDKSAIGITLDMTKSGNKQLQTANATVKTEVIPRNQGADADSITTMASCGNQLCEPPNENSISCDGDCPPVCGNGVCESGETFVSCPADCLCGNGICSASESCSTCAADCGSCCGNGICGDPGEFCSNCSADCGTCSPPPCFLAKTTITMADGTKKPIEKVKIGDHVLSFDDETNQFKPDKVTQVFKHVANEYLVINGHLKVTPNHPVFSNGKWVEIGLLKKGDRLFNEKGKEETIHTIKRMTGKITTYNIEVNPYHSYIAGGYVVHNKGSSGHP